MTRMAMKLAAVSKIALLLLCCLLFFVEGSADSCTYAEVGKNVTLTLDHTLRPGDDRVRWKHEDTEIYDGKYGVIGLRNIFVDERGFLTLNNVSKSVQGRYKPEVHTKAGKKVKDFAEKKVCVYDPLYKPEVTFKCDSSKVTFTCVCKTKDVKFSWWKMEKGVKKVFQKKEATLKVNVNEVQDSIVCEVSNGSKNIHSEPLKQPCKTDLVKFPEKIMGISIWVFVGGGAAVVLVLIISVIVCCIRAKRKRHMRLKDEEELRLHNTDVEHHHNQHQRQQQHQHQHQHQHQRQHQHQHNPPEHHHYPQQQPAGHTGPRQHRPKMQRPRAPDPPNGVSPNGHPQPSPRRPAQGARRPPEDEDEQPPPLPQPRKKAPKAQRV